MGLLDDLKDKAEDFGENFTAEQQEAVEKRRAQVVGDN